MAMGTGAFKILFVVATIAVAGGMIASQAFDVPALFGSSDLLHPTPMTAVTISIIVAMTFVDLYISENFGFYLQRW